MKYVRKLIAVMLIATVILTLFCSTAMAVSGRLYDPTDTEEAAADVEGKLNNLAKFIFTVIRVVGVVVAGWGLVQIGISFQSHDPSQRSQGFLALAGGLIIVFTKEILIMIGVNIGF